MFNVQSSHIFTPHKRTITNNTLKQINMEYVKDNGKYVANYSGTFGKVDNTALALVNSCKYIHKDKGGEYVKDATSFDESGNIYFTKRYLKK